MSDNNIIKPKTLPGFMELLPNEQILFNKMKDIIRDSYEEYGFLPLNTPIIEDAKVLLAKAGGETEKQIYRFEKGDNDLALRFDLTVPLAKYVTEYYDKLSFPFRRYQIGKVYRGEKPQRGRYREFYQCDIDIIGDGKLSIINDAEIPSIIYNTFKKLGFDDFTICINNRKILNGLFKNLELANQSQEILRVIDKIDKIGIEKVREELSKNVEENKLDIIMKFLAINGDNKEKIDQLNELNISDETFKEGLNDIKQVLNYIEDFGVPEENIKLDLTIARGLDYYTGTVYETFLNQYRNMGSVCSGGRYDNLTEYYTNKKMPGVGISIGLSRLFFQLIDNNIISAENESLTKALIVSMTDDYSYCARVANDLRKEGIKVQVNFEEQKLGKKFKYADNIKVEYVIIIGEDEIANNQITLKNMKTGEQQIMELAKAVEILK
ncbi:MAG: histidine--tRNA ligase [Clostridia bacterium]|nr:histidine--tRNA ligase [Clostridia bacterium]